MNLIYKLESLRANVWYWQGLYDKSDSANARKLQDKLNSAKELLKAFKRDNMPHLLEQPKRDYVPYQMLADKFEVFENYLND
jgi:hypothetical protein